MRDIEPTLARDIAYDPESGIFRWTTRRGHMRAPDGAVAGTRRSDGYIVIRYLGVHLQAHRLAWRMVHGQFPDGIVDHVNRVRDDNRIGNLRIISNRDNILNSNRFDAKAAEEIGATLHKQTGKWQASICLQGRKTYLGLFSEQSEACAAYRKALETEGLS